MKSNEEVVVEVSSMKIENKNIFKEMMTKRMSVSEGVEEGKMKQNEEQEKTKKKQQKKIEKLKKGQKSVKEMIRWFDRDKERNEAKGDSKVSQGNQNQDTVEVDTNVAKVDQQKLKAIRPTQ